MLPNFFPLLAGLSAVAAAPFFESTGTSSWIMGNEIWNVTQGRQYATKLYYKNRDCVGTKAKGHYFSYNELGTLSWNSADIASEGTYDGKEYIDVRFTADSGEMHWVLFEGLHGAYQYFVNTALPQQGEFRSLWRLENTTFTNGKTNTVDVKIPPLSWYKAENKIADETWKNATGDSFLTKYNFGDFVRTQKYYGVYGSGFGSWFIMPGKDYFNGNHLKQELMFHRESNSGDVVLLNMLHGTHYQVESPKDDILEGKMFGPWLWYLNDGSSSDADARATQEHEAWPYEWLEDSGYQARGTIRGKLSLSDGREAANAAVFLGDDNDAESALGMGTNYYYTTYADEAGTFVFEDVREGSYKLQAWANGGVIGDVSTVYVQDSVQSASGEVNDLGDVQWETTGRTSLFQVGTFDRLAAEFQYGGSVREHNTVTKCAKDLTWTAGSSEAADWCFGQTWAGTWIVVFDIESLPSPVPETAYLIVHLAGYSNAEDNVIRVNGEEVGTLSPGSNPGPSASESLLSEQSLYRSATSAGEWRHFEFSVPGSSLVQGQNEVTFEMASDTDGNGYMWDSIKLEW